MARMRQDLDMANLIIQLLDSVVAFKFPAQTALEVLRVTCNVIIHDGFLSQALEESTKFQFHEMNGYDALASLRHEYKDNSEIFQLASDLMSEMNTEESNRIQEGLFDI